MTALNDKPRLTQQQLDELEATHGRIAHVRSKQGEWEVVFRKPTRAEYKQYRARHHNPMQVADAQEILARQTVVYPSKEAFDALLEVWPAIPETASEAFRDLLDAQRDDSGKV